MGDLAPQIGKLTVGKARNIAISFSGQLDTGEILTGTPTLVDCAAPSPQVLTFSNIAINTAILTINGVSVPVGEAVQGSVTASVAGNYEIRADCSTDATPAQALDGNAKVRVKAAC